MENSADEGALRNVVRRGKHPPDIGERVQTLLQLDRTITLLALETMFVLSDRSTSPHGLHGPLKDITKARWTIYSSDPERLKYNREMRI
jgi:hypothetical protein